MFQNRTFCTLAIGPHKTVLQITIILCFQFQALHHFAQTSRASQNFESHCICWQINILFTLNRYENNI